MGYWGGWMWGGCGEGLVGGSAFGGAGVESLRSGGASGGVSEGAGAESREDRASGGVAEGGLAESELGDIGGGVGSGGGSSGPSQPSCRPRMYSFQVCRPMTRSP